MKMLFGGVYKRKYPTSWNDQQYGYYVPCIYEDKEGKTRYRMVDTYMIGNLCWGSTDSTKEMEKRIEFLEGANKGESAWRIFFGCRDYYYQNIVNLYSDELNEDEWELIADLHDYKLASDRDAETYKEEDRILTLPLWHEDSYRWGSGGVGRNYVKKDAKPCADYKYYQILHDISFYQSEYGYEKDRIIDLLDSDELSKECKAAAKKTIQKIGIWNELKDEFRMRVAKLEEETEE